MVSIHGPLGYGPSTLPLRHSALLNTLTFYPSRYLYICCLKNPIFFRNCKNSIHDWRQIVCAKFQTCNSTRHRIPIHAFLRPDNKQKRKQKSLQIEIKPGILLHQLQQGLKNNQRIFLAHHTFFTVSAVWIATEISERKVAVWKQTIFSQLFSTC